MKKKMSYIILGAIICVFTFGVMTLNNNLEQASVATSSIILPNKKIGWGIKRVDNHEQPDLGSSNRKVLEQYNGIAMGNNEKKYIYLTFDQGYEAGYTSKILETLKNNDVKATFFITAHYVNTASDIVQRMIDEGYIVGNQFPTTVKYHIL